MDKASFVLESPPGKLRAAGFGQVSGGRVQGSVMEGEAGLRTRALELEARRSPWLRVRGSGSRTSLRGDEATGPGSDSF